MATLPPGFLDALANKYAILDRDSQARAGLENAQASQVAPNAASQRALQGAQTGQVQATTATVAPLAQSQINTSLANAQETQARSGLFGAQTQSTLHDSVFGAPEDALRSFGKSVLNLPDSAGTGNVIGGNPTTAQNQRSVLDPTATQQQERSGLGFSRGTANVQPLAKGMPGYAQGTSSVPGPGQTVTTGSWEGPVVSAPTPTSTLASQAGIKRVPRIPLSKGTAKVPGKGSGNVDTVPAELAPGEAVLNKHAAEHMGRGLIGVLNALGNAKAEAKKAPATKGMP